MNTFKYLIIGGGVAGTTAAETLRKNDREGSVAIVSDEPYPLYSRVMLSKPGFLKGEQPVDNVWLKKSEWYEINKISLFSGLSATHLNVGEKKVTLSDGQELQYEKLLLATGAHARKWPIPGAEKNGVLYMRTLDDTKKITEKLSSIKHAVIIGSGFVSFEIADVLCSLHIPTTLVMREKYYSEPLVCEDEGKIIERTLEEKGVKIIRDMEVTEVLGDASVNAVLLKDGSKIECDVVFCMIGVVLPNEWLKDSGVTINRGVVANEFLETNIPDIWSAGDGTEFKDTVLDEAVIYGNWMNSRTQGEIAAFNMFGQKKEFRLVSFQTSHGFGNVIGFVGDIRMKPDRFAVCRGVSGGNTFCRLIIKEDRIMGATMVNKVNEMGTISKLIQNRTDISALKEQLSDPNFDLKTLIG